MSKYVKTGKSKELILSVIREHAGHKTMYEIASIARVTYPTINKYASMAGISLRLNIRIEKRRHAESYISQHAHHMTAGEISQNLKIPLGTVYNYGNKLNVYFKSVSDNVEPTRITTGNFFNVNERENWAI